MIYGTLLDHRSLRTTVSPYVLSTLHNVTCLNVLHVLNTPDCQRVEFWLIHESLLNAQVLSDVQ